MEEVVTRPGLFLGAYENRRVLVTGHTGFKGSWLSAWLSELGATVAGFSKYRPSDPCNFDACGLAERVHDYTGDVQNIDELRRVFRDVQPEIVFHLAAQPIVRESYSQPKLTFDTNLGGTVNCLECIRETATVESAVIITSDKCYDNVGWDWGYRESDRLGGEDPYSASKACAEIAFRAYFESYFRHGPVKVATARAGNVIGGGDWAADRIVPDCIKAWSTAGTVTMRNPHATRPWQHVLEPLSGYLWLAACLRAGHDDINGEAFNFGPTNDVVKSVGELVELLCASWGQGAHLHQEQVDRKKEADLLKLNCDKALRRLKWSPLLSLEETIALTSNWYRSFYDASRNPYDLSLEQIDFYVRKGSARRLPWAGADTDA